MYKLIVIVALIGIAFGAVPVPSDRHSPFTIVGGEPTDISEHPWQINLIYLDFPFCAGFLISDSWALTAAFCNRNYPGHYIRAGSSLLSSGGELVPIEKCIIHPDFDGDDNDISLIKLSRPVTTPNAKPAILPAAGEAIQDDVPATVIGWGRTKLNEPMSEQLLQVQVQTINHKVCEKAYMGDNVSENMFCVGLLGVGGKGPCKGDLGGPVEIDGKAVGIVSWSYGCATADFPSVQTKISNYIDWIRNETGLNL